MSGMCGLTIFVATDDPERFRAALTLACARAATSADPVRVYCHERAVSLLSEKGDTTTPEHGLPDRLSLLATASECGVRLYACPTGLTITENRPEALVANIEIAGLIQLLADRPDDALIAF